MIIPDLKVPQERRRQRLVVGFSGPIASGKTAGAKFLEERGFCYGRYSKVLAGQLSHQGIAATREALQEYGEKVHRRPGQRWLSRQLIASLPENQNLVIDGLRFPEDHAFLVETFGSAFVHIHVTAPKPIRCARYVANDGTEHDFNRAIAHKVELEIPRLERLATHRLQNDGARGQYYSLLEDVIRSQDGSLQALAVAE